MHNELLHIGPLTVYGYGFMIAMGVLAAWFVAEQRARKLKLACEHIFYLVVWCAIGGFTSAKILFWITNWREFLQNPRQIIGSDGFVVYGGIIGGILVGWLYCRIKKLKFLEYFDLMMPSIAKVVPALASVQPVLGFLGEPFVALTIATVVAMVLLGYRHGYSNEELEKVLTKSLEPTGLILLVTACGGVLRFMLQNSGLGDVIGNAVSSASLPIVVVAFVVAALVRISVGSATVAMTMAAGIIAAMPEIATLSPLYLACVTAAVAGGATVCSHFNDSGFWLVKSLVGLDEKTTLKTWTIMETLVGGTGFVVALIISFFA